MKWLPSHPHGTTESLAPLNTSEHTSHMYREIGSFRRRRRAPSTTNKVLPKLAIKAPGAPRVPRVLGMSAAFAPRFLPNKFLGPKGLPLEAGP
ncbi:hypothetical protein MRX96_053267 [Rhipicephalus microplus]